jgi:head-tail adaptor
MRWRLDRQMVLEAPVKSADGAGGYAVTWTALGTLWAAVAPGAGRAAEADLVGTAQVPLRIVVRAVPPGQAARPAAGQRLVEGGRRFPILAVAEADAAGRYLTCFAREEAAT